MRDTTSENWMISSWGYVQLGSECHPYYWGKEEEVCAAVLRSEAEKPGSSPIIRRVRVRVGKGLFGGLT